MRREDAPGNDNVLAGAVAGELAARLDDNRIIAAGQMAVPDFHVATMVGINAVIVGNVEPVADGNVIHQHMFTAEHVQAPERGVAKGDVAHHEIGAAGEHKHLGPPFLKEPPFVWRIVIGHEGE